MRLSHWPHPSSSASRCGPTSSASSRPAGVGSTPRGSRRNSRRPVTASSACSCCVTAGWDMCSVRAASVTDPARWIARNARNRSMSPISPHPSRRRDPPGRRRCRAPRRRNFSSFGRAHAAHLGEFAEARRTRLGDRDERLVVEDRVGRLAGARATPPSATREAPRRADRRRRARPCRRPREP